VPHPPRGTVPTAADLAYRDAMQWSDEAIVLSVRAHGETAAVLEVLTRAHGRHLGLVHGGRSRRARPVLQPGNHVDVTWKARLADQLGQMTVEPRRAFAALALDDAASLAALSSMTAQLRLLAERDPHASLFEATLFVLGYLDEPDIWPALVVRWEMVLLAELGFGLDLTQCAATGSNDALIYVSPRTGRAVSASAGEPYRDKLLALPAFLLGRRSDGMAVPSGDIRDGFMLTGHFLRTHVLAPRGLTEPAARHRLLDLLERTWR
jgi:DNA repair protein RecO (recombination protein O)